MRAIILILVALVPIGDIVLLWFLWPVLGGSLLLAWIILTAIVGMTIFRLAGANALRNISLQMHSGRMPGRQTIDDGLHVLGALLLAFPGFITDIIALPLLIRGPRRLATSMVIWLLRKRFRATDLDETRPVYTIGPDGRPIRDIEVEIHDEPSKETHDRKPF